MLLAAIRNNLSVGKRWITD